jgi:hypothetical protein
MAEMYADLLLYTDEISFYSMLISKCRFILFVTTVARNQCCEFVPGSGGSGGSDPTLQFKNFSTMPMCFHIYSTAFLPSGQKIRLLLLFKSKPCMISFLRHFFLL